jgi:flagellar basal-body rod protein FlgC
MSISAAMGSSLFGMQTEVRRLSTAAHNVANAGTSPNGQNVDTGQELLDTLVAEQGFKANASVFETGADMWDVLMTMVRD